MRTGKINKVVTPKLCNMVISSAKETEKLLAGKDVNVSESKNQNEIRINEDYRQIRYTNGKLLPPGMEAYIIALINGALS